MTTIESLLQSLRTSPETIQFSDVIAIIDANYNHTPTAFTNGTASNASDQNQGSAKVLSFARLQGLTESETLACFAEHYRSVTASPEGTDHQNIRQFMVSGWSGVDLPEGCLTAKDLA
jgi:hypothetical protein